MPILQIRDKDGKFIPITIIQGNDGKSAYEQAKEGGYNGTEQEFIALLNGLTNSEDAAHYSDFNNPHKVTALQTGAIPEAYYASNDLDTEISQGGNKITVCNYHSGTLNTPYTEGLTVFAHGMVITNANSNQYGTQMCLPSGEDAIYVRRLNGGGVSKWVKITNLNDLNTHIADASKHIIMNLDGGLLIGGNLAQLGIAIGYGSVAYGGVAVGVGTETYNGFAGGDAAVSSGRGGAVGNEAVSGGDGFAGGYNAQATSDSIQLGAGANPNYHTIRVYDYELMNKDGVIPAERLPKPFGTYTGSGSSKNQTIQIGGVGHILMISSSNNDIAFVHANGSHSFPNNASDFSVKVQNASFVNGVLTLTNNSYAGLNASGITYYYQVL